MILWLACQWPGRGGGEGCNYHVHLENPLIKLLTCVVSKIRASLSNILKCRGTCLVCARVKNVGKQTNRRILCCSIASTMGSHKTCSCQSMSKWYWPRGLCHPVYVAPGAPVAHEEKVSAEHAGRVGRKQIWVKGGRREEHGRKYSRLRWNWG